jgi:hypothetical protein
MAGHFKRFRTTVTNTRNVRMQPDLVKAFHIFSDAFLTISRISLALIFICYYANLVKVKLKFIFPSYYWTFNMFYLNCVESVSMIGSNFAQEASLLSHQWALHKLWTAPTVITSESYLNLRKSTTFFKQLTTYIRQQKLKDAVYISSLFRFRRSYTVEMVLTVIKWVFLPFLTHTFY